MYCKNNYMYVDINTGLKRVGIRETNSGCSNI